MSESTHPRGLARATLDDGAIVVYTVTELGPASLVPWRDSILTTLREWDDGLPYLALHDLSAKGVSMNFLALSGREIFNIGITKIGQNDAEAILAAKPNLLVCLALVVSSQYSGQVTVRLGMPGYKIVHPQIKTQTFFDKDEALEWLRAQKLPKAAGLSAAE